MTDHLGNNRVVTKADGTQVQKTHYYPFGSSFGVASGTSTQPYKYNGKELDKMHGLNLYDYSARYYESAIGRFTTVDPLAEKYYSISPYVYCNNNPLKFIDLDGRAFGPPDEPIKLRMSPRLTKVSQAAQRVSESSSQVFSGSQISISGSAYSTGAQLVLEVLVNWREKLAWEILKENCQQKK